MPQIQTLVKRLSHADVAVQFEACEKLCDLVGTGENPPLGAVIAAGAVPLLLQLFERVDAPVLQYAAAAIIVNLVSDDAVQHTQKAVDHGAIAALVTPAAVGASASLSNRSSSGGNREARLLLAAAFETQARRLDVRVGGGVFAIPICTCMCLCGGPMQLCEAPQACREVLCGLCNASIESGIFICRYNTFTMFTEATYTHHDTPRARCLALSEANSGDVALKMSGALTTNSHSNELKCTLVERILDKTAQHGFISMSRATERSAHRRRQGAI